MRFRLVLLMAVFVAFTGYTAVVVVEQGYFGFLDVYAQSAWAGQVFVDLVIALVLFLFWMVGDARRNGIAVWPYLLAVLTTGSIGALAYLIHRTLRESGEERGVRTGVASA